MIKTIHEIMPQVEKLRNTPKLRGEDTGFKNLDALYSVKLGTFTIVLAEPTHGKSEFIFEMIINQAEKYGRRSFICSPETGSADEVVAELVHKKTGKRLLKSLANAIEDKELYETIAWLNEYFLVIDTDEQAHSIPELFDYANQWEKANNKKIHIIVGEPYNELKHDMQGYGGRQDLYIEDLISEMRRRCRREKKHFFLSLHPSGDSKPVVKDNITYYPKPLPRQAAGGQALYRKAMTWITLWRPPVGLKNEYGQPYGGNEVEVHIDKAKPKGVSTKGKCSLFFNWIRNRYHEGQGGNALYAFEHETAPKELFSMDIVETKDAPF